MSIEPTTGSAREARLEQVLDGWREWGLPLGRRPRLVAPVPGGRTNRNFRLDAPGMEHDLLLRLNHPDPERLGIDRGLEHEILSLTAREGIGRRCCHWDPAARFALFPWLEARSWTLADMARPEQRVRLWPLLERLGQIRLQRPRRCYHAYLLHYWRQLEQAGRVEPDWVAAWQAFEPRLRSFAAADWPARLVHHDLIPENILDTGQRLYLIDWEYAAPGHPDIDAWSVDPGAAGEPFVAEMMGWINDLWERLAKV
ncbi:MAG: phosphotransferase [Wenzhouxiangellaceae bacterium]|nr:phosphotransferase [Wenzhouxiangellaceae bacterium]